MFKIKVSDEIILHCQGQIEKFNFGKRGVADGTPEQQLTGIIGQSVVMQIFKQGLVDGSKGFDDGADLMINQKKVDVKTMGRTTDVRQNYTNNFLAVQDKFDTDLYIFCSFNKKTNELTVCGLISKILFGQKRKFFPKGSTRNRSDGSSFLTFSDLFEIDIVDILDIQNEQDLITKVENALI
jgi:hypothetical protein